jgi:cation:H+ antiporter
VWIGTTLLAIITSLPELSTSLGAILVVKQVNLSLGNIFGSNIFNLMVVVLLDVIYRGEPVLRRAKNTHILSASLGLILIGIIGFFVYLHLLEETYFVEDSFVFTFCGIGIYSPIILILFFFSMFLIFRFEKDVSYGGDQVPTCAMEKSLKLSLIKFSLSALVVVLAGVWLSRVADRVAVETQLGHTFVGTIFLAITTSLPELVVSIEALRIKRLGMAIGNVLGSNIFNVMIIPLADLLYPEPVLQAITPSHLTTILLQFVITSILLVGLIYKFRRSIFGIGIATFAMLISYIAGASILYRLR